MEVDIIVIMYYLLNNVIKIINLLIRNNQVTREMHALLFYKQYNENKCILYLYVDNKEYLKTHLLHPKVCY